MIAQINTRYASYREEPLSVSADALSYVSEDRLEVMVTCDEPHGLYDGDTVILSRYADAIEWRNERVVTVIDDWTFKFASLDDIEMDVVEHSGVTSCYRVLTGGNRYANYISVKLLDPHPFTDRKTKHSVFEDGTTVTHEEYIRIRENVPSVYYSDKFNVERPVVMCPDGHVVCYDFLYRIDGLYGNKYLFTGEYLNNDTPRLYFYDKNGDRHTIGGGRFSESKDLISDTETGEKVLVDRVDNDSDDGSFGMVVVPVDFDGNDVPDVLYLCYSPNADIDEISILTEQERFRLYCADTTYYTENGEGLGLSLRRNTSIIAKRGELGFDIPISVKYDTDLFKYDIYEAMSEDEAEKLVNKPLDFEKVVFEPYGFDKLTFRLHTRERDRDEYGELINYDTDETKYWNQCGKGGGERLLTDTCYDLGFTEDDVFYQKKCVSETFIRVMVYSANVPSENDLLHFDNMYLDSGLMYKEYVGGVINEGLDFAEYPMVRFTSTHKFNLDYTCDGYYLYMYPIVMGGSDEAVVYMNVRFYHAKYGKTMRMLFRKPDNDCYWDGGKVDLNRVYEDLYLPIRLIRENNRLYWIPEGVSPDKDGELVITLWEPRINGVNGV